MTSHPSITTSHLLQPWIAPPSHDRLRETSATFKHRCVVSCLDDSILMVSGTRPVVNRYHLTTNSTTNTTTTTNSISFCKDTQKTTPYQLHAYDYLEAHHASPFHTVCQSTDAIYAGCRSGDVAVYGLSSRAWSKVIAHGKPITCMSAPKKGGQTPLLTGSQRGNCAAHDPSTMLEVGRASAHTAAVTWLHMWKPSCYLSTSSDGTAALWDARLPPKTRITKRFEHGTGIVQGVLFGQQTLCTASLVLEKYENQLQSTKKKYIKRKSVHVRFWDMREGKATDDAKITWNQVDIHDVLFQAASNDAIEGTRQNFTMLTVGTHKKQASNRQETVLQGCDQRGVRQFSFEPTERSIIGGTFCTHGVIVSSPHPKTASVELCFVPIMLHTHQEDIQTDDKERRRSAQRLAVSTWNKRLAKLGAQGKCIDLLEILVTMEQQHVYPTAVTFEVILRALVRHKALLLVASVLDHMEQARAKPTDKTLIALLRLASSKRTTPFAQKLMRRLSKMGNPTVREVFIELLLVGATKASLKLAFDMLMETVEKKLGITRKIVRCFLKAAHARNNTELAFLLLTAMNQRSNARNGLQVEEYATVACMLGAIRETDKALSLLSQALQQFGLVGTFEMACSLIKSFGRAGLLPIVETIRAMLHQYHGDQDSPANRAPTPWKLVPRVLFAAAHIDAALSCAQPSIAMNVLSHLDTGKSKSGGKHNCFASLSHVLIRFVSVLEADVLPDYQTKVIGRMQEMGMDIPYDCLVSLLGCLALRKRITESMYLFNTLRHFKHKGEDRTSHAFSVLVSAVGRAGLPRHLDKLLNDAYSGQNVVVAETDLIVVESSVEALRCVEQPRRAVEIWKTTGRRMTRLVCNNVILCYGLMCQIQKISEMVKSMFLDGCRPDTDTYAACIIGCISAGRLNKASFWLLEYCRCQERRGCTATVNIAEWWRELSVKFAKQRRSRRNRSRSRCLKDNQTWNIEQVEKKGAEAGEEEGLQHGEEQGWWENGEEEQEEDMGKKEQPTTQMYGAIRRLLSKQQRLRRSSRSHPTMMEAMVDLIDRLVRTNQLDTAMRCLKRIFWVTGTTDPAAAMFVLKTGVGKKLRASRVLVGVGTGTDFEGKIDTEQKYTDPFQISDLEWILRTIEPRRLVEISPALFGRAVERAASARESALAGHVAGELIQLYVTNGGRLSSEVVEAMLHASEYEREGRMDGTLHDGMSYLEHPVDIWKRANEYGIDLSDRARLLLLRALVAAGAIDSAMHFLRSFHGKGCRVTPLSWMLQVLRNAERFEDAMWVYRLEKARNQAIPSTIIKWLKEKKPSKEVQFRQRQSLEELLKLKRVWKKK